MAYTIIQILERTDYDNNYFPPDRDSVSSVTTIVLVDL